MAQRIIETGRPRAHMQPPKNGVISVRKQSIHTRLSFPPEGDLCIPTPGREQRGLHRRQMLRPNAGTVLPVRRRRKERVKNKTET